ncbi:hypothetical protein HDV62DRAFT_393792 [Trichoderma sp. SZMC 28011]
MSQQPSQAFSTPPEPARHADGDVITGLQEGTVVLLSLVCTNPRYPSRPVAAVEGRVRIRPRARLADSTEARASLTTLYGVSVVTSFAGIFTLFYSYSNKNQPNGMDKHVWDASSLGKACCLGETTSQDLRWESRVHDLCDNGFPPAV